MPEIYFDQFWINRGGGVPKSCGDTYYNFCDQLIEKVYLTILHKWAALQKEFHDFMFLNICKVHTGTNFINNITHKILIDFLFFHFFWIASKIKITSLIIFLSLSVRTVHCFVCLLVLTYCKLKFWRQKRRINS